MSATPDFSLTFANGEKAAVSILPIDIVMYERKFKKSLNDDATNPMVEHMLWLAWHALLRAGGEPDFERFLENILEFDEVTEDEPSGVDPTPDPSPS